MTKRDVPTNKQRLRPGSVAVVGLSAAAIMMSSAIAPPPAEGHAIDALRVRDRSERSSQNREAPRSREQRIPSLPQDAAAASRSPRNPSTRVRSTQLRPLNPTAAWLLANGADNSPMFRRMVEDLEQSDVVVYIESDPTLSRPIGGRIAFVTAAGGLRYVRILLASTDDALRAIVSLVHELRHALEIAADPLIVDQKSMAEEYLAMASVRIRSGEMIAETWQATAAAAEVDRELRSRHWALAVDFEQHLRSQAHAEPGQ